NTATISGGSSNSYVNGKIQKAFNTGVGPAFTFPIGDASVYAPVTSTMNVTNAGNLTASTVGSDHPNIATSPIDASTNVSRYWTITNTPSGIGVNGVTNVFNFVAGDLDAGANTANFIVANYNGTSWITNTVASRTTTNITAQTVSPIGDFAVGSPKNNQTINFTSPGGQTYGVSPITLTATASSTLPVTFSVASGPASVVG